MTLSSHFGIRPGSRIPVLLRKRHELHLTSSGGRDSREQVVQQDARRDGHVQAVHAERRLALAALGRRRDAKDVLRGTQVLSHDPFCALDCQSTQQCARDAGQPWCSNSVQYRPPRQAHALNNILPSASTFSCFGHEENTRHGFWSEHLYAGKACARNCTHQTKHVSRAH